MDWIRHYPTQSGMLRSFRDRHPPRSTGKISGAEPDPVPKIKTVISPAATAAPMSDVYYYVLLLGHYLFAQISQRLSSMSTKRCPSPHTPFTFA